MVTKSDKPVLESDEERAARWRRFWAEPASVYEDLTLDEIEEAGDAYWRWDGEPKLDR